MRYLFGIFALLLASFALAQYNDPDGMTWVLIYGVPATMMGFAAFGKTYADLTLGALVMSAGMSLLHLPGLIHFLTNDDGVGWEKGMSFEFQYIEQMREFGGLLIVAIALFVLWRHCRQQLNPGQG